MDFHAALLRKLPASITVTPIYAEPEKGQPEARNECGWSPESDYDEDDGGDNSAISMKSGMSGNLEFIRPDHSISSFDEEDSLADISEDSGTSFASLSDKVMATQKASHLTGHLARDVANQKLKKHKFSFPKDNMNLTDESRRSNGLYSCHECPLVFTVGADLEEHLDSHAGDDEIYRCQTCLKSFRSWEVLQKHERIHNGTAPYRCTLCSKTFNQPVHLKAHLRRHNGETPYKCSQCPKAYADSSSLTYHERAHAGLKSYNCLRCPKGFSKKGALNTHLATHAQPDEVNSLEGGGATNSGDSIGHEEDSNYSSEPASSPSSAEASRAACLLCEKTFRLNSSLRRHVRMHHGGNQDFSCRICFQSCSNLVQLRAHDRANHSIIQERPSPKEKDKGPELRFICATCSDRFASISALSQHKLDVHSN